MLAYIKGTLEEIIEDSVVVDCQGIGYRIYTSLSDIQQLPSIGQTVKLHTYMCVREDDVSLYGFCTKEALSLFRLLISVSGIGPKAGLALLSALSVSQLQMAIVSGDVKALTKANGVGAKGAQRVIVELKDKVGLESMVPEDETIGSPAVTDAITATAMALTGLGYSQLEAMQAIKRVDHPETLSEEALLKAALRKMI